MIKGIHHTGLTVLDLGAAITYWTACFGFALVARFEPQLGAHSAFLTGPTGHLKLTEFDRNAGASAPRREVHEAGLRHACLQTKDANALFNLCTDHGMRWHARPAGLGTGQLYAYVRDPEENIIEIEGVPWAPAHDAPWYAHAAIVTPDIDRLTAFYEELTGTAVHNRGNFGPHRAFDRVAGLEGIVFRGAWIRLANASLEFWQYDTPRTTPTPRRHPAAPGWSHVCFEVESALAAHARLAAAGIALDAAPAESPLGTSFTAYDPDGNRFECLEVTAPARGHSVDSLSGRAFLVELDAANAAHYKSAV
jgi:catechol 2,3-dioxygenase-like lactoylglutathione lyase family enzyme